MPINLLTEEGFGMIVGSAGESFTGLLDTYGGAAAAYSVRRLSSTYEDALIEVRRSSDNTTQDIGYDANGDLDTAALLSFVGAGDGFVRTWYDQSGNGNDAQQTTTTDQFQIVSSGSYLGYLDTPSLATGQLISTYNYILGVDYSIFKVVKNNGNCVFGGTGNNTLNFATAQNGSVSTATAGFTSPSYFSNGSAIGLLRGDIYAATTTFAQLTSLVTGVNTNMRLGYISATFNNSLYKEFIIYPNQTVSRTGVENNQIEYYGF